MDQTSASVASKPSKKNKQKNFFKKYLSTEREKERESHVMKSFNFSKFFLSKFRGGGGHLSIRDACFPMLISSFVFEKIQKHGWKSQKFFLYKNIIS